MALAIRIFSSWPDAVETYYATGAYPYISGFQRILFGWIPFSIGDFLYLAAGVWLLFSLIRFIRRVFSRNTDAVYFKRIGFNLLIGVLAVYVFFNLLWGLNYNRRGIDYQLKLQTLDYTNNDLKQVTKLVAVKLNDLQHASEYTRKDQKRKRTLFSRAVSAYDTLHRSVPFISYNFPSVKPSLYSYLGNYLGFTGYYNPFTGEAQVNTTVPLFVRPFTTCHEIGHQLGYAKESEANFAGYLSAISSNDTSFLYSVYFDMFAYCARYLYYADSVYLRQVSDGLSPAVKSDIRELRRFYKKYENPFETAIDRLYSQYLKANEQPSGKMSYNEVVSMLIAYYKRHGRI